MKKVSLLQLTILVAAPNTAAQTALWDTITVHSPITGRSLALSAKLPGTDSNLLLVGELDDEAVSSYQVTADALVLEQTIASPGNGSEFGFSVDISRNGRIAVVGEPGNNRVRAYRRYEGTWAPLDPPLDAPETGHVRFGHQVMLLSDDFLMVCALLEADETKGTCYLFDMEHEGCSITWRQYGNTFTYTDGVTFSGIRPSRDRAYVAKGDPTWGDNAGRAFVTYTDLWGDEYYTVEGDPNDRCGSSLDFGSSPMIVGCPGQGVGGTIRLKSKYTGGIQVGCMFGWYTCEDPPTLNIIGEAGEELGRRGTIGRSGICDSHEDYEPCIITVVTSSGQLQKHFVNPGTKELTKTTPAQQLSNGNVVIAVDPVGVPDYRTAVLYLETGVVEVYKVSFPFFEIGKQPKDEDDDLPLVEHPPECIQDVTQPPYVANETVLGMVAQTSFNYPGSYAWNAELHPGGSMLAIAYNEEAVVWSLSGQPEPLFTAVTYKHFNDGLAWSPGGELFVVAQYYYLALFNPATWEELNDANSTITISSSDAYGNADAFGRIAISPDGTMIARSGRSYGINYNLNVWRFDDPRTIVHSFERPWIDFDLPLASSQESLAWSPDGSRLAWTSYGSNITLFSTSSWSAVAEIPMTTDEYSAVLLSMAWSPDSAMIATTTTLTLGSKGEVWNATNGEKVAAFGDFDGFYYPFYAAIDWSSDGSLLVAGDTEANVTLWSTETWEKVASAPTTSSVVKVMFGPDDSTVAAVGHVDGPVQVFNIVDQADRTAGNKTNTTLGANATDANLPNYGSNLPEASKSGSRHSPDKELYDDGIGVASKASRKRTALFWIAGLCFF